MSPAGPRPAPPARGPRVAATAVALVVVLLVAVLAGLLRNDGSGEAEPGTSRSPAAAPAARSATQSASGARDPSSGLRVVPLAQLPAEARRTLALVDAGGPFPYPEDGSTFGNHERVLPAHARGWYREYTVRTPGERDRGPRRIVTGDGDREVFYTADHYVTFVRVAR